MRRFYIIHPSQDGWTNKNIINYIKHLLEIFLHNKLQDISIAKYCQAQPSPSLAGLSCYINKTRVSS